MWNFWDFSLVSCVLYTTLTAPITHPLTASWWWISIRTDPLGRSWRHQGFTSFVNSANYADKRHIKQGDLLKKGCYTISVLIYSPCSASWTLWVVEDCGATAEEGGDCSVGCRLWHFTNWLVPKYPVCMAFSLRQILKLHCVQFFFLSSLHILFNVCISCEHNTNANMY